MQISTIVLPRLLRRREVGISAAAPKPTEKSHSRARPFSDSRLAPAAGTCRHSSRGAPPGTDRRVTPGPLAPSAWWREARCWLLRVSVFPFLKWAQELEILSHGAGDRDRRVLLPLGMSMPPSPPGQARPVDPPPGQVQGNAAAPAARALGPPASQRAALPLGRPTAGWDLGAFAASSPPSPTRAPSCWEGLGLGRSEPSQAGLWSTVPDRCGVRAFHRVVCGSVSGRERQPRFPCTQ